MNLLELFSTDRRLLETRGSLIIRQLCLSLNTERIYRTFAEILEKEEVLSIPRRHLIDRVVDFLRSEGSRFCQYYGSTAERHLGDIAGAFRLPKTIEKFGIKSTISKTWAMVFLLNKIPLRMVKHYSLYFIVLGAIIPLLSSRCVFSPKPMNMHQTCCLSCKSVLSLLWGSVIDRSLSTSAELEITVQLLVQIDKLVQLIESPVFTCMYFVFFSYAGILPLSFHPPALRLQLLEPEKHPYLFKCLYGLLMLLPQSSAFISLRNRLNAVSSLGFMHVAPRPA